MYMWHALSRTSCRRMQPAAHCAAVWEKCIAYIRVLHLQLFVFESRHCTVTDLVEHMHMPVQIGTVPIYSELRSLSIPFPRLNHTLCVTVQLRGC